MKTKSPKRPPELKMPGFVADHIKDTRERGFLNSPPANVDVNAPRALIQCVSEGHLQGIGWMLGQTLYASAPKMLAALKEAAAVMKAQNKGCCLVSVLAAIEAAEVRS